MVQTGLSKFIADAGKYRGRSIGLIANQSSVHGLRYSWDLFHEKGLKLLKIFSPEHGLFSTLQDQVPVLHQPGIHIEVVSLYGSSYDSLFPVKECLAGIDTLVFDIQDVGSRYYTYVNTMVFAMKAASALGMEFIVLDRPNPLGGVTVEGPVLEKDFESFVGILPVPVRHGLTAGELALFARDFYGLDMELKIITMDRWERGMAFEDTGLTWIPPSPNMPSTSTAAVYPGACLFEGLNASEGRGTTRPFEIVGAPYVDPYELAERLRSYGLGGVVFRPLYFMPAFHKFAGENAGGVFIHVTDRDAFRPFAAGVALTKALSDLCEEMKFLYGVYEFNSAHPTFDLLTGGSAIREMVERGEPLDAIADSWKEDEEKFLKEKKAWHLY